MKRPLTAVEAVGCGLALCYVVHDTEELVTYAETSRWAVRHASRWLPLPATANRGVSQGHIAVAVPVIGLYWVGAALEGCRTGGRSAFFQDALWAWGVHGVGHVVASALRRGYTSGVATAPLVIAHWVWAERTLRRAGVPKVSSPPRAIATALAALVAAHAIAGLVERARRVSERAGSLVA